LHGAGKRNRPRLDPFIAQQVWDVFERAGRIDRIHVLNTDQIAAVIADMDKPTVVLQLEALP
jgi:hypothetical protein